MLSTFYIDALKRCQQKMLVKSLPLSAAVRVGYWTSLSRRLLRLPV